LALRGLERRKLHFESWPIDQCKFARLDTTDRRHPKPAIDEGKFAEERKRRDWALVSMMI
jgi:aminoglycoside phosphotransferase